MEVFAANDQVMVKKRIRSGNLIRFGSIVKVDGDKALVNFPIDHTSLVIPVAQLQKTDKRFGTYKRVQPNPVLRSFTQLVNR
jgi:ribosomal protein S1